MSTSGATTEPPLLNNWLPYYEGQFITSMPNIDGNGTADYVSPFEGVCLEFRCVAFRCAVHCTTNISACSDVFVSFMLISMIAMTVVGNSLVILSIILYRKMRTFTNILLASLSTADFLVGLVIMPLAWINLIMENRSTPFFVQLQSFEECRWVFGRFVCAVWATLDVLLCTASILNLCVISLDRYFAITSPLHYTRQRTRRLAAGLLTGVWVLSLVICSPPMCICTSATLLTIVPLVGCTNHGVCSPSTMRSYKSGARAASANDHISHANTGLKRVWWSEA